MSNTNNSRRDFLKTLAGAGLALGTTAPAAAGIREDKGRPTEKVIVAVMGTNGRGTSLAEGFAALEGSEVAYVCDVDERAIAKASAAVEKVRGKKPKGAKDFRQILDDQSVDALVIAAPDHWHAPATILACKAGKHVYVEKPCSYNPREGELMVEAARKYQRVVQMGNQRRSWPKIMEAMQQLREGVIGRVYYSRGWYANTRDSIGQGRPAPVPSWLDYELWQGPAPRRAFQDNLIHYNWHWFWHWGTGEAGNNGVHAIDLCRWGLEADYPIRVTSAGGRYHWKDDWETPDTQVISFDFEGGKTLSWESLSCNGYGIQGNGFGATFHGQTGTLVISGAGYTLHDRDGKLLKTVPEEKKIDHDAVHLNNFIDAIRKGVPLNSEIEEGHKSTLLCHLGNIAQRTHRTLECDPKNGRILGDREAMKLWSREYEPGWEPAV